jgi:Rod binding domain-containing protein
MIAPVGEIWAERLARLKESGRREDPELVRQAAAEFEALLVAEMLKSARASGGGGWLGSGEDQAGTTMVELAEQQFAQALAAAGGLGLADLLAEGLRAKP